jgi:hypothetical protein
MLMPGYLLFSHAAVNRPSDIFQQAAVSTGAMACFLQLRNDGLARQVSVAVCHSTA